MGSIRTRLALVASILTAIAVTPVVAASAGHVAPTVGDTNMGNLAGNERELNIVVDPNNPDILAGGANERGIAGGTQRWYTSTDGGRNWNNGRLPSGTLTVTGVANPTMSDPSLDFGSNGEVYYSALMHGGTTQPCTLFVTASTDLGVNWTDPANGIVGTGTTGPNVCHDKEHIAVDRQNNDNVYVAWTPIGGTLNREAVFSRDLNGVTDGFAFSTPTVLSNAPVPAGCLNQGADFALDPNTGPSGTIYVAWTSFCSGFTDGDPGTVYVVSSTNQGAAWSTPVAAATLVNVNPNIATGFRSRSHPSIDVDPASGRVFVVYATYADAPTNSDADVMIVSSPNASSGSWTAPARINQDAGTTHQVFPWIGVGNGRVHVVYSSAAGGGSNWDTRVASGAVAATPTFTEIVVSSATTPFSTGFIGDYHGNIVGTDDVVHPAWGDGRAVVGGNTYAFTARVNFSPPTLLTVSPLAPTEEVGNNVTLTATVTGAHGEPETFIPVTFSVTSAGTPSSTGTTGMTNASGELMFTYTNTTSGVDDVHVFADLNENMVEDAGEAIDTTVTWNPGPPASIELTPENDTNTVGESHTVTANVEDQFGNAVPGETVTFSVASGPSAVDGTPGQPIPSGASPSTDGNGEATFAYTNSKASVDTITGTTTTVVLQDTATKTWDPIVAQIDINPGSDPNSFGAKARGQVPVALLGSATFDAGLVDDATVLFGDAPSPAGDAPIAHKSGHAADVNLDPWGDRIYHFRFTLTGLDPTDTAGCLGGEISGLDFLGCDDVNIVPG